MAELMKGALIGGTVISALVTGAWSVSSVATGGPAPAVHLSVHHLLASYMSLAAAPTGNAAGLFAVVAAIYALCLFAAGMRARSRRGREHTQSPAPDAARPMAGGRR